MKKGYVLLISVLIIGAVSSAIAVAMLNLGSGITTSGIYLEKAYQAKGLAEACAEEALQQIRDNTAFASSGSLALGNGSCTYLVTNLGSENRQINTTGTIDIVFSKIQININQINPKIIVSNWQEI